MGTVVSKVMSKHLVLGESYKVERIDNGGNFYVHTKEGGIRPYSQSTFEG